MGSALAEPLLVACYQKRNPVGLWCHLQAGNRTISELENALAQVCNAEMLLWKASLLPTAPQQLPGLSITATKGTGAVLGRGQYLFPPAPCHSLPVTSFHISSLLVLKSPVPGISTKTTPSGIICEFGTVTSTFLIRGQSRIMSFSLLVVAIGLL